MSLLEQIKAAQLAARKSKDAIAIASLTTLIGAAEAVGKKSNRAPTDEEVVAEVKKALDGVNEFHSNIVSLVDPISVARAAELEREIKILEQFRPQQMTEEELRTVIAEYKNANPAAQIGHIMGYLKGAFAGRYDGKLASALAKG